MYEKIIDKNLSRIIKIKMCTNNLNSLEEIEDISIQDINLMQNKLNIDLTEIIKLKNLKNISLKFFEITDEIIEAINKLKHIETIEFYMCSFRTKKILSSQLKSIIIYNCQNFEFSILERNTNLEEIQLVHSGIIDMNNITEFKNLKFLKIAHCNAINISNINVLGNLEQLFLNHIEIPCDIDISKMSNLKLISLSGSNVSDKESYIRKLYNKNKEVKIEFEKNDLPIE
ncbi:MAG: hypothetical protein HFJ60_03615 [Clostridia bacterium]|jgi:hypothetical protein|nr:hypothetical protein [Clostridia bacterium]